AAIRKLQRDAREVKPADPLALATRGFLATLAARTRQLEQAERLFRSCLDQPNRSREIEADVYSGLLQVLGLRYKHEATIEVCKHGLEHAHVTNRVLFHAAMGRAYMYLGNMKACLTAYEAAVADAGKNEMLLSKRRYIDALSHAGQHDRALAECQALLKE